MSGPLVLHFINTVTYFAALPTDVRKVSDFPLRLTFMSGLRPELEIGRSPVCSKPAECGFQPTKRANQYFVCEALKGCNEAWACFGRPGGARESSLGQSISDAPGWRPSNSVAPRQGRWNAVWTLIPRPCRGSRGSRCPDPWGVARDRRPSLCPRLTSLAPSGAKMSNLQVGAAPRLRPEPRGRSPDP